MKKYLRHIEIIIVLMIVIAGVIICDMLTSRVIFDSSLEVALQAAGKNRIELEKVLHHYQKNPADSLKYKAACFLIENMPYYTYSVGEQLDNYKSYYAWLKPSKGKTPQQISDSIQKVFGPVVSFDKKRDIQEIDSAYLCNNIEWAFKVWQEQPWGKNISFDTFCEYILPHRIGNEPLAYWREMYYEKYNPLLDSLRMSDSPDKEDPAFVAKYLMKRLPDRKHYYTTVTPYPFGHIGPEYVQYLSGSCNDVADFGIYLFRALGIPCAIDFFPSLSYVNSSHYWVVVWDKNGEDYLVEMPIYIGLVRRTAWYKSNDSGKAYRYTYSVNRKMFEDMAATGEEVPPFWSVPKFIDVTREYGYYYKEELVIPSSKVYKEVEDVKLAYLCFSERSNWTPIDWAKIDSKGNIVFRNVRKGGTMRVAAYKKGMLCYLTDPFYVDKKTNEICYFSGGEEKQDVKLFSKYPLGGETGFRNKMMGGVFEASNRVDFSEKDTVFIIQQQPTRLHTTVRPWSDKAYRYYRYVGAPKTFCHVAEISFYERGDTAALKGTVMGPIDDATKKLNPAYGNAFDGKTWTSFSYSKPTGGWVGLDFGKKVRVDRIEYTHANRDNYVRTGDTFELFYCDRDWVSAGLKRADSDSLIYRDIPVNSLLLLRNHTRGLDERIFTYENGDQVWK